MSKIAGEINAEMMHPKVIHEQRKALFAEMVRKTGSQQSVLDRLIQEIQFLREQVALLRDALKEAVEGYSDRFDMSSPSTNPGIKMVVKQGKEALAATEPKIAKPT